MLHFPRVMQTAVFLGFVCLHTDASFLSFPLLLSLSVLLSSFLPSPPVTSHSKSNPTAIKDKGLPLPSGEQGVSETPRLLTKGKVVRARSLSRNLAAARGPHPVPELEIIDIPNKTGRSTPAVKYTSPNC